MTLREQVKAAIGGGWQECTVEETWGVPPDSSRIVRKGRVFNAEEAAERVMDLIGPLVELARDLDVWTSATSSWTLSDLTLKAGEILDTLGVERHPPPFD